MSKILWFFVVLSVAIVVVGMLSSCGSADSNPTDKTCYACSGFASSVIQRTYACTASGAQQFGRPCLR